MNVSFIRKKGAKILDRILNHIKVLYNTPSIQKMKVKSVYNAGSWERRVRWYEL